MKTKPLDYNYDIDKVNAVKIEIPRGSDRTIGLRIMNAGEQMDLSDFEFAVRYTTPNNLERNLWFDGDGGATAKWNNCQIDLHIPSTFYGIDDEYFVEISARETGEKAVNYAFFFAFDIKPSSFIANQLPAPIYEIDFANVTVVNPEQSPFALKSDIIDHYKGSVKFGAATESDMRSIPIKPATGVGAFQGDVCDVLENMTVWYFQEGAGWLPQTPQPAVNGDTWLIEHVIGTYEGIRYDLPPAVNSTNATIYYTDEGWKVVVNRLGAYSPDDDTIISNTSGTLSTSNKIPRYNDGIKDEIRGLVGSTITAARGTSANTTLHPGYITVYDVFGGYNTRLDGLGVHGTQFEMLYPRKSGTFALVDDVPAKNYKHCIIIQIGTGSAMHNVNIEIINKSPDPYSDFASIRNELQRIGVPVRSTASYTLGSYPATGKYATANNIIMGIGLPSNVNNLVLFFIPITTAGLAPSNAQISNAAGTSTIFDRVFEM